MIRSPKPICRHPLDFTVTITLRNAGSTLSLKGHNIKVVATSSKKKGTTSNYGKFAISCLISSILKSRIITV